MVWWSYGTARATSDPAKQPTSGASELRVECELCKRVWPSAEIQQHMGGHLLESSWSKYRINGQPVEKPAFPCGICGTRESVGQQLIDQMAATEEPSSKAEKVKTGLDVNSVKLTLKESGGRVGLANLGNTCFMVN